MGRQSRRWHRWRVRRGDAAPSAADDRPSAAIRSGVIRRWRYRARGHPCHSSGRPGALRPLLGPVHQRRQQVEQGRARSRVDRSEQPARVAHRFSRAATSKVNSSGSSAHSGGVGHIGQSHQRGAIRGASSRRASSRCELRRPAGSSNSTTRRPGRPSFGQHRVDREASFTRDHDVGAAIGIACAARTWAKVPNDPRAGRHRW